MTTLIKNFLKEEQGTETVEWAFLAALLLAAGGVIWANIGGQAASTMEQVPELMTTP